MSRLEPGDLKSPTTNEQEASELSLPSAERHYRQFKEVMLDLPELAASVQAKTGWDIDISRVSCKELGQRAWARCLVADMVERTRLPALMPTAYQGHAEIDSILTNFSRDSVATYLPSQRTIVINYDVLRRLYKDSVKICLHHELTHVAQHQRAPEFSDGIDRLLRERTLLLKHGGDLPPEERQHRFARCEDKLHARMSLVEGQAVVLQQMYEKEADLHPEVKIGPVEVAFGLNSLLIPGAHAKVPQYIQGAEIFRQIHASGPDMVNRLFSDVELTDRVFRA